MLYFVVIGTWSWRSSFKTSTSTGDAEIHETCCWSRAWSWKRWRRAW